MRLSRPGRTSHWLGAAILGGLGLLAACGGPVADDHAVTSSGTTKAGSANPSDPLYEELREGDVARATGLVQDVLEHRASGAVGHWQGAATDASGQVTLLRTFKTTEGHFCREYDEAVTTRRGERSARRLACRTRDGHWLPAEPTKGADG